MSDARGSIAANTTTTANTSFTQKKIKLTVTRAKGNFASSRTNTIVFENLRIQFQGLTSQGTTQGVVQGNTTTAVFGLSESDMNDLYYTGEAGQLAGPFNTIRVEAGDDAGMTVVHVGQIISATQDFNGMPDAAFIMNTISGYDVQTVMIGPSSFGAGVPVSVVLKDMAGRAGLNYVDQGIPGTLTQCVYEAHSARDQIAAICQAYNVGSLIESGTLYVWDKKVGRKIEMPIISATTGLMGYPTRDAISVNFKCLYNPKIHYAGPVKIESSINQVNGIWLPTRIMQTLQSETPGGFWMMDVSAQRTLVPF